METRIALIGIIVENPESIEALNHLLHEYGKYIIGRMGIPYREREVNIISVAIDAPQDVINALSGKIGRLDGIGAKTVYSNITGKNKHTKIEEKPIKTNMNKEIKSTINKVKQSRNISLEQLKLLLEINDDEGIRFIREEAVKVCQKTYGNQVLIRGLIEFTNFAKRLLLLWDSKKQFTSGPISVDKGADVRLLCQWI